MIDFGWQIGGASPLAALDAALARATGKAVVDYGFHLVLTAGPDGQEDELEAVV